MKNKEAIKLVVGSIVVYIAVACSSAGTGFGPLSGGDDASTTHGSSDGAAGNGSGGAQDTGTSIIDALTDPVAAAMADPNQSGSRLKAKYYVGGDGSKTFASMHDIQLDVDCSFGTAADGSTRCLPSGGPTVEVFFGDSGCSQALAFAVGPGCNAAKFALQSVANAGACTGYSTHVFPVSTFSGTVYEGSPTSCSAVTTSTALAQYVFYQLGTEVAPSQLVQGMTEIDP